MKATFRCLFLSCLIVLLLGIGNHVLAQKAVPLSEQEKAVVNQGAASAPASTSGTVTTIPATKSVKKKSSTATTPGVSTKPSTTVKKTTTVPVTPAYTPPAVKGVTKQPSTATATGVSTKPSTGIRKTATLPVTPSNTLPAASASQVSGKSPVQQSGSISITPRTGYVAPSFTPTPASGGTGVSGPGPGVKSTGTYVAPSYTPPSLSLPSKTVGVGTAVQGQGQGIQTPSGSYVTPLYDPPRSGPLGSGASPGQPGSVTATPRSGGVPLFPAAAATGTGGQEQGAKTTGSFLMPSSAGGKEASPGADAGAAISGSTPSPVVDNAERLQRLREKYDKGGEDRATASDKAANANVGTTVAPASTGTSTGTPPRSELEIRSKTLPASPVDTTLSKPVVDNSAIATDRRITQENPLIRELSGKDMIDIGNKLEQFINSYGGLKGGLLGGAGTPPGSTGQSRIPGFGELTGGQDGRSFQSVKDSLDAGLTQSGSTGNIPSLPGLGTDRGTGTDRGSGYVSDTGFQSPMGSSGGSSGSSQGGRGGLSSDMNKRSYVASETATVNLGPFGTLTYHKDDNGNQTVTHVPAGNTSGNTAGKNDSWATNKTNTDGSETTVSHYHQGGMEFTDTYHINERGKVDGWSRVTTDPKTGKTTTANFDGEGNLLPDLVDPSGNTKRVDPEHNAPPPWVIEAASRLLADIRSGNFHLTADENVIYRDPDAEGGKRYQSSTQLVKPPRPDQPIGPGETRTGLTGNEPTPDEIRDPYGTRFGENIDPTPPTSNDQGAK